MAKKIIKVEETKEEKKKSNIDLAKIGSFIRRNRGTIEKVVDLVGDSISKDTKTKKKKTKKTKAKKSDSTVMDLFDKMLK